ncbi:fungal specific transcription factor domain-containing protein [Aspergillus lucknowensis]|uniref:Xylanolytic transcriptional activator regulatory domain-containing protein n=1 Tax=Aspergillus lucknowensis TaxID=176173 RepID=A0ABR4L822_9EURO
MAKLPTCLDQISRAHSVLTGMLVRLAECMGLHRDPTEFGFTPTECQTRRLIWYQICYLDLKTSEIQGPRQFIHYDGYTTQLPLDITCSQTSPGWNDMIFSMIRFECQEMQRRCLTYRNRLDRRRMSLTKALSKIEAFRISMDGKYSPYINTSSPSPMQKMAGLLLKLWVSLLYLTPLHRYMNSVTYRVPDRLRQIVLIKGTEALEAAVELESSEELQQWAWYSPAYQQYHTAFLLLVEMFNFPLRREANRIWRCLDFIFAEPLANIPPLKTVAVNPTVDEIIEHRAVKARYLLTLISERMRAYHQAKRSKLPSHFKESMIVITPQKAGDASDARLPLNYAHGEPEVPGQTQQAVHAPQEPEPIYATTEPSHPTNPAFAANSSTSLHTYPRIVENASNMWHTSSGNSSPWIQASYPDVEGEGSTYLHPNYQHQYRDTTSTTSNASVPPSHSDTGDIDVDPQLLEIDWNLWDTIFPPQANDGNLDISDGYAWEPYVPYGYNTSERSF